MSIPTFSTYQPPGVYVQDVSTPVVVSSGVPSRLLVLAGPALGYRTSTESFVISAASAYNLVYTGAFTTALNGPPPVAAPVVTNVAGIVLTAGVDYTLTVTPDPSGNPGLAVTSVTRVSTSPTVSDGAQVSVTYNYADAGYFQPQTFTDYQSVINAYGQPFLSTVPSAPNASQVANPLTLAALLAMQNGANTVLCVALDPSDGTLEQQFAAAYTKLANNYSASIIVPVFADDLSPQTGTVAALSSSMATDLKTSCVSSTAAGYPQIGLFGLPRNYLESSEPITTMAASLNSPRLVLVYPEIVYIYNSVTGQTFQASGCYLAVALGAILSRLPVNTGLTMQQLSGFSGFPQTELALMTPSFMNELSAAGTCVVFRNYQGVLVCRQGITTDTVGVNEAEISMVRQTDALGLLIQLGMQNQGLIGQPITATMVATVQGALMGLLEQAVNEAVIVSWTNLSVVQQVYPGGNPTIIACTFSYATAVPLNYITVTMAIDLSNGAVSAQSSQNASTNG
jgi:hypothetical protein